MPHRNLARHGWQGRRGTTVKAALLMLAFTARAAAGPMSFHFATMPAFDSGALAGQTSSLWVTVEPTGSNPANAFSNRAIVGVAVRVGSMSLSLDGDNSSVGYWGDEVFLMTDPLGIPTLDLTPAGQGQGASVTFSGQGGRIQLGKSSPASPGTAPYLFIADGATGFISGSTAGGDPDGFRVIGTTKVPTPATLLLVALGSMAIAALSGRWSRERRSARAASG